MIPWEYFHNKEISFNAKYCDNILWLSFDHINHQLKLQSAVKFMFLICQLVWCHRLSLCGEWRCEVMMASGGELWKLQCVFKWGPFHRSLLFAALTKATSGNERLVTAHIVPSWISLFCRKQEKHPLSVTDTSNSAAVKKIERAQVIT